MCGKCCRLLEFHFTPSELERAFRDMDVNRDGRVSFSEFCEPCCQLL
eukprot:COSAG01_NODE_4993_length_4560_cov_31.921991_2_plen_47_part_00